MTEIFCINSSKVYCKCIAITGIILDRKVLIVAKCIVNILEFYFIQGIKTY